MSVEFKKATKRTTPSIQVGGTEAFLQEAQKNMKFRPISFVEGKCHRRIVITSAMENVYDEETGKETQVVKEGLALFHLLEEFLGVPVKNDGYREDGLEFEFDYTKNVYNKIVADILKFDCATYEDNGGVSLKTAYANFVSYVEKFAAKFNPTQNPERSNIVMLRGSLLKITEEQMNDPEFDAETAYINHFKALWKTEVGEETYGTLFEMTFWEAVKTWILKNVRYKISFTPTANANFSGVPFYGALPSGDTEEGKHQSKVINQLASVARVLSQHTFEEESKNAEGLTRGTDAYNKLYNEWVSEPKTNRQLIQRPALNGIIFVLDSLCAESCTQLEKNEKGEIKFGEYIHSVSANKLAKMDKTKAYDSVLMNPDFMDIVFKYTTGETRAQMGQQLNCAKWEGKESTLVPIKDIKKLIDQTNSPTMPERINTYQPFPFDDFVTAFKKYLIKLNEKGNLDFIKADETLFASCKSGFEAIGFDLNGKEESIETILQNSGASASAQSAVASLGINIAPAPTPVAQAPTPTATPAPTPVAPTPQPEPVAPTMSIE